MKKVAIAVVLILMTAAVSAQVDDGWDTTLTNGWIDQSDFDRFRQQSEVQYANFRDSANARFARALEGKWQPFEVSKPLDNPRKPEPKQPPVAPKPLREKQPVPQKLPAATLPPAAVTAPPQPRKMDPPTLPAEVQQASVPFYNTLLKMEVPRKSALSECKLYGMSESAVSHFWQSLAKADMQGTMVELLAQQQRYKLNDWGLYDMTFRLAQAIFPDNENKQVALTVFLLNQMEYDVRMGRTEKGLACLLAIHGDVYDVPFITLSGTRYYIFLPHNGQHTLEGELYTYTVTFASATHNLDVVLHEFPQLPQRKASKKYSHTVAGKKVELAANQSLMDFYSNYPQVEISIYATAAVGTEFAAAVERNFRPFVEGKSNYEAVSALLNYMHYGFDYATDQEQFGYEKPFFCEENFYYPKNDCEDRSILFSYLVRTLVGLEVVLLDYPDHIATAVCFPQNDVGGDYYLINGKAFVVCDPTYIGAPVGACMPQYKEPGSEVKVVRL